MWLCGGAWQTWLQLVCYGWTCAVEVAVFFLMAPCLEKPQHCQCGGLDWTVVPFVVFVQPTAGYYNCYL